MLRSLLEKIIRKKNCGRKNARFHFDTDSEPHAKKRFLHGQKKIYLSYSNMWSALDRSYALASYRSVKSMTFLSPVDFAGDETNSRHSHYKELTTVENLWLRLPKGSYIYHGTTNSGSYIMSSDVDRLESFMKKKSNENKWMYSLEPKPMYFTNKQYAKAYGRSKTKPINLMLDYNKEEWSTIKVLYQEHNSNMGFEIQYETTKNLNLLDFTNPMVVREYGVLIGERAPFLESFLINDDGVVERVSSYEKDALWISILEGVCKDTSIDGYYFCCEGLHEEILLFNPTTLKHVQNLYAEAVDLLPDVPLKKDFLKQCLQYNSIQPFPYLPDTFCEQQHHVNGKYLKIVKPDGDFFRDESNFKVNMIEVESVFYVLYFTKNRENRFYIDPSNILTLDEKMIEDAIEKDDTLFNVKTYDDGQKMYMFKNRDGILAHFGKSVFYKSDYCIKESDLNPIPTDIPTSTEFLEKFNPIDYHNDFLKTCTLFFRCETEKINFSRRLFPVPNLPQIL